jgi:hypothetical protein
MDGTAVWREEDSDITIMACRAFFRHGRPSGAAF